MEKQIIHGRMCVKRGEFWYAVRKPITTVDYWARRNSVPGNWREYDTITLGNNKVIINQR